MKVAGRGKQNSRINNSWQLTNLSNSAYAICFPTIFYVTQWSSK